jgi:hypothetical protein
MAAMADKELAATRRKLTSAADLKFLQRLQQTRTGTSNR